MQRLTFLLIFAISILSHCWSQPTARAQSTEAASEESASRPTAPAQTSEPLSQISDDQVQKLNAAGKALLQWIEEERVRQPTLPTGYYQKIPERLLCDKASELLPEPEIEDENRLLIVRWFVPASASGRPASEEDALSPYFLARALKMACVTKEIEIYDPRLPEKPPSIDGEQALHEEGYPACPQGPRATIRAEDVRGLWTGINAFDHLKRVAFSCIGARLVTNNPYPIPFDLNLSADDVLLLNSRLQYFGIREAKIGRLRIVGSLVPEDAGSTPPSEEPAAAGSSGDPLELPQSRYPGSRVALFIVARSEIGELRVGGSAIGQAMIGTSKIAEDSIVARSELGALSVTHSKLKSLSLFQLRLGAGAHERGHSYDHGAIHVTNNDFEADLRIGAVDDAGGALYSQSAMPLFDQMYGPPPPWLPTDPSHVTVRGYITLAQNRIAGQLHVRGLNLDGFDRATKPRDGENANPEKQYAFFNVNNLSARAVTFTGNNLRFGPASMLLGDDVKVTGDVIFSRNVIHRMATTEAEARSINRPQASETGRSEREAMGLIGFQRITARDVRFDQNLIIGPIGLTEPTIRNLFVLTAVSGLDKIERWAEYCFRELEREELAGDMFKFPGGAARIYSRQHPSSALQIPSCYGSIVVRGGSAEGIAAHGLISDLLIIASQVKTAISVSGRVTGVVNLVNTQMKDGVLLLGEVRRSLLWCNDGQLLMDGTRLAAFQADAESFRRYDCDSEGQSLLGPIRMGMRVTRIDQIMGQPRLTLDDPTDAGLLGLTADELKRIVAPAPASARGWLARLWRSGGDPSSAPTTEQSRSAADFDPQSLSVLATRLREAGFVAKANDLSMERVSRQRWESQAPLDRLKWLLGWPVGWGYQTEWAFIYAVVFIFIGAWVAAYYREYPDNSPPDVIWLKRQVDQRRGDADRPRLRAAGWRVAMTAAAAAATLLTAYWLPATLLLTQNEALTLVGVIFLIAVVLHLELIARMRRPSWWRRTLSIAATGRHLGYHAFFFSLDRFLPSPGFHNYWGNYPRIGQAGRNYFYLHRLIGLLLISITAAGAAGLFE